MSQETTGSNVVDRRMALAREWDELVEQVRELDGFEDFLAPPKLENLLPAAARGPVVIVNVSRWRCDALLVRPSGVTALPLPSLSLDEVTERANRYLSVLRAAEAADLERAVAAWRSAWTSGAPAVIRFRAAHAAADALARAGVLGRNPETWVRHAAAEAYEIALRVLPVVVWPGLAATTREEVLAGLDGFATAAAAAALAVGEHDQALRQLEAGRSLLWQQRILPTADRERLAAHDAQAAARLSRLQVALNGAVRPR